MSDADRRIAELERQVALLRAQLGAVQELPNSSVEARLRALLGDRMVLDALPAVVNVLDRANKIVYLNRTVPGRNVTDLYGSDARTYVAEADRERYTQVFDRAWETATPARLHLRTVSGRHWETSLIPVKEGAEVVFMLVTTEDVTDRVMSEQALRESEARLRYALAASRMGAWTYRVADDLVTWDALTAELFGVAPERAPRNFREYLDLIHPADRGQVEEAIRRYVETGTYVDLEHRVLHQDGSVRTLLGKGAAWLDEAGNVIGLRGGVFDVTARKELEKQLQLAQKMQAVGQLTAGIAHNLNNALSVIIPSAEDCRDLATEEVAARAADVVHAARRAAEMVRQLMLFAHPHAGAEKRPFDVAKTARRIVDMCRKTFDRRITLSFEATAVPPVRGNEGQIEQVLLNVCLNARDAVSGPEIAEPCIRVRVDAETPERVRITIADDGTGMDETVRARVFEPFFTTKALGRGTGLGLASAYAIVADHGGVIRCKSEPSRGTTIEIELPVADAAEATHASEPPRAQPAVGRESVLVVDDEDVVRRVIASLLERAGYRVRTCSDGAEAVRIFESGGADVDLILLDRSMPGLGGEQVLARLRTLGVTTKVILFTGDPGGQAQFPGASLVLRKPVDRAELLAAVRAVLDGVAPAHG